MLEIKRIKEEISKNKDNKPIVVIDSGIRGRANAAKLFELSKETEWEFFQDGSFIPQDFTNQTVMDRDTNEEKVITKNNSPFMLPESVEGKIEMIKELKPQAVFIASDRINNRLQRQIVKQLDGIKVYTSEAKEIKKTPIIIVDSGAGGMKIAKMIHEQKPAENIILITDNKFLPYGNQDHRVISRRAVRIMAYIKNLDPKAVILGCNTLDSLAGSKIEAQLGNIPLVRIINPVAKAAVKASKTKNIGLIATKNTIESQKYMYEMLGYYPNTHLLGLECPDLATAVESRENLKEVFKTEVSPLHDYEFDTLILGCTHYSNILPMIKKEFTDVTLIDSVQVLVDEFINLLENKLDYNKADKGSLSVVTTQKDERFDKNVERFFGDMEVEVEEETIV